MKGLKNNNYLIILLACACVLVLTKRATEYFYDSLSRSPVIGSYFQSSRIVPENLGNLYPVFAQSLEAQKNQGAMKNIDQYFVPPPKEAPAPPPPVYTPSEKTVDVSPPKPEPKPKPNYLKTMIARFSLDGLSNHGAYINGRFYQKGEVVFKNRIDGQPFIVKISRIKPDSIILADNHKNWQAIKFKQD
jgi:hypothetical protein